MFDILTPEFLATALVVVLVPGTGVVYTLSYGVFRGVMPSIAAAFGCTLGIVPHLLASILGLAALLHTSAVAFKAVKLAGIAYLLYLAWGLWRQHGALALDASTASDGGRGVRQYRAIVLRGALINILNPKLSIFFLAFLPQFVPAGAANGLTRMSVLSITFMVLTFVIFVGYGVAANAVRQRVLSSARLSCWLHRTFAAAFAGFAVRLALTDR